LYDCTKGEVDVSFITIKDQIALKDFVLNQTKSVANIYIRSGQWKNIFSTKFFELVATKRPILYFGPEGDVSDFLEKHQLGYHVREDNMKEIIHAVMDNMETKKIPHPYDLSKNTFEHETNRLIEVLEGV
jgi:hypothetical protein